MKLVVTSAALLCALSLNTFANEQLVSVSNTDVAFNGSTTQVVKVNYDTDTNQTTSGLGLAIYFNSKHVSVDINNTLREGLLAQSQVMQDSDNADGDSATDSKVVIAWASMSDNWPTAINTTLFDLALTKVSNTEHSRSQVNIKPTQTAVGYTAAEQTILVQN